MIDANILPIISEMRKDARVSFSRLAKELETPQSTLYERARLCSHFVKRNVALLDYQRLGINAHMHFAISIDRDGKARLENALLDNPKINTLYLISEQGYLAEGLFNSLYDAQVFFEGIEQEFAGASIQKFTVLQELKKEEFLTRTEHNETLGADAHGRP